MNLKKVRRLLESVAADRKQEIEERKRQARRQLWQRIDAGSPFLEVHPTALRLSLSDIQNLKEAVVLPLKPIESAIT